MLVDNNNDIDVNLFCVENEGKNHMNPGIDENQKTVILTLFLTHT